VSWRTVWIEIADKKESQDICFVPDTGYKSFVENVREKRFCPGPFIDETGKVVGNHQGILITPSASARNWHCLGPAVYVLSDRQEDQRRLRRT